MDQEYLNLLAEKARMETKYITELSIAQIKLEMQTRISNEQDQIIRKQKEAIEETQQTIADRDRKTAITEATIAKVTDDLGTLRGSLTTVVEVLTRLLAGVRVVMTGGTELITGAYGSGYARGWTDAGGDDVERDTRARSLVVEMTTEEMAMLLGPLERKFKIWMEGVKALTDQSVDEKLQSYIDLLKED